MEGGMYNGEWRLDPKHETKYETKWDQICGLSEWTKYQYDNPDIIPSIITEPNIIYQI